MRNFLVLTITVLLSGFFMVSPVRPDRVTAASVAGCYTKHDGLGYDFVELTLKPDGQFKLLMSGHMGTWGSSSGTWSVDGNTVRFVESESSGEGKDYLDTLIVGRRWPHHVLARTRKEIRTGWGKFYSTFYQETCNR